MIKKDDCCCDENLCDCGDMCECEDFDCCDFDDDYDCCDFDDDYDEPCYCSSAKIGKATPDFIMQGYFKGNKDDYFLSDYTGKWVILFFYPLDFTFVCPTEIKEMSKRIKEFEKLNAQVLGISVDSVYSHEAWSKGDLGDLKFPLLSDITKNISRDYGVLIEEEGISLRGTFIIDPKGILRSMTINDNSVGRNVDEILRTLCALQTGELCPIGWKKGDKTLGKG